LEACVIQECLLNRIQLTVRPCEPFDRQNAFPFGQRGKYQAAANRPAGQKHRARSTHTDAAPLTHTAQMELVPQHVEKRVVSPRPDLMLLPVNPEPNHHSVILSCRHRAI
jgi:hypothetical protein